MSIPILLLLFLLSTTTRTFTSSTPTLPKITKTPLSTYIVQINPTLKPTIFPTHTNWYTSQFSQSILHTYDTVLTGFSTTLTPSSAETLRRHPAVISVIPDRRRHLSTTRSPQFLGLRIQRGLWSESDYGTNVIIGILDTGIWPERRSFSDHNLGPIPNRWKGVCEPGQNFGPKNCNKKIIGARFFNKGHEANIPNIPGFGNVTTSFDYKSARDADGHGTHTASTAAGRYSFNASMSGYAAGVAKGVAPKARIAVYKVCWKEAGCFDSDILAGFDAAVNDGVDVISISIGGGDGISSPYYLDPIAIGSYGAVSKGVFVSSSAGNDGPNSMSVTNLAPWVTTVGAGTIDRNFPAEILLSNGKKISGVSLYSGKPLGKKMYPVVYPGKTGTLSVSLCMENSLDPELVKGKIVICDRGSNPRVAKGLVVQKAGGVGMILANGASNGEGLVGDAHLIPAVAVGADEADAIKAFASSRNPMATLRFKGTVVGIRPAPVLASFSGRGPNGLNPEILKPDLIAPGVNILAAWTDAVGPTGLAGDTRRTEFNILSGTSMACPHVSGAAALLKSAHPDWSPAMIKSAMMTSASLVDNRGKPMIDEASPGKPATPYDFGAGHLNLDQALDPGLVYDLTDDDYVNFLCSIGYGPKTIQVITRVPVVCNMKRKAAPENLNYPSLAVSFPTSGEGVVRRTFVRTVTNVGAVNSVYKVNVESPARGVMVKVNPTTLVFNEKVKKISYTVSFMADSKNLRLGDLGAGFGAISWSDGSHVVRSPIVVTQVSPL
ncbi:subtilisin-like protease SBT1.6 [Silene latifolia]|uniref:subtilisin-like protease SBT1.6 n=1 Tax=Silene latifolia TaxID=37657 RepID=UPI003D7718D7